MFHIVIAWLIFILSVQRRVVFANVGKIRESGGVESRNLQGEYKRKVRVCHQTFLTSIKFGCPYPILFLKPLPKSPSGFVGVMAGLIGFVNHSILI